MSNQKKFMRKISLEFFQDFDVESISIISNLIKIFRSEEAD